MDDVQAPIQESTNTGLEGVADLLGAATDNLAPETADAVDPGYTDPAPVTPDPTEITSKLEEVNKVLADYQKREAEAKQQQALQAQQAEDARWAQYQQSLMGLAERATIGLAPNEASTIKQALADAAIGARVNSPEFRQQMSDWVETANGHYVTVTVTDLAEKYLGPQTTLKAAKEFRDELLATVPPQARTPETLDLMAQKLAGVRRLQNRRDRVSLERNEGPARGGLPATGDKDSLMRLVAEGRATEQQERQLSKMLGY